MMESIDVFDVFVDCLEHKPTHPMWSIGGEILCESIELANMIADVIDKLFETLSINACCVTGSYDDSVDYCLAGWHYIDIA